MKANNNGCEGNGHCPAGVLGGRPYAGHQHRPGQANGHQQQHPLQPTQLDHPQNLHQGQNLHCFLSGKKLKITEIGTKMAKE